MPELQFPNVIDNSMRKGLVKCQKYAHWKFERGLNDAGESEHLVAGGAFAKGIEATRRAYFERGMSQDLALIEGINAIHASYKGYVPPAKSFKTADRVAGSLAYYLNANPFAEDEFVPLEMPDGKRMIEVSFNHEIPILHPVTGKRLTYCGRFDMLAISKKTGLVWVNDEKTTSRIGEAWSNQWALDSQMTGYVWGARKLLRQAGLELEVAGAIINGVAIMKYDYETVRYPTYRQDWEVQRWYVQMLKDVDGWIDAFKHQSHNQVLDHACALYNAPCEYARLCKSGNPERILGSYEVRFWNPLERQ